jgi:hypothetical protein
MGVLTLLLVTATIESKQYTSLGFRPKFSNTQLGKNCADAWDLIKNLRNKSAQQGGVLSKDDQGTLDFWVLVYNTDCRDVFNGNPRLAGDTGVVQNPGGGSGIVESGPKTPKNADATPTNNNAGNSQSHDGSTNNPPATQPTQPPNLSSLSNERTKVNLKN